MRHALFLVVVDRLPLGSIGTSCPVGLATTRIQTPKSFRTRLGVKIRTGRSPRTGALFGGVSSQGAPMSPPTPKTRKSKLRKFEIIAVHLGLPNPGQSSPGQSSPI